MAYTTYSIHFEVFDPYLPVPEEVRHLLFGNYHCALRSLVEQAFATDPFWKYEGRVEIGVFVRSDTRLSIRSQIERLERLRPPNKHEIQFDSHMTNEEFEANYDEIVRACGIISDAILTFTREHLNYLGRPGWRIVRTSSYE